MSDDRPMDQRLDEIEARFRNPKLTAFEKAAHYKSDVETLVEAVFIGIARAKQQNEQIAALKTEITRLTARAPDAPLSTEDLKAEIARLTAEYVTRIVKGT